MIVDLDSIVRCTALVEEDVSPPVSLQVSFCDGTATFVTESGFDRIMQAWRSNG